MILTPLFRVDVSGSRKDGWFVYLQGKDEAGVLWNLPVNNGCGDVFMFDTREEAREYRTRVLLILQNEFKKRLTVLQKGVEVEIENRFTFAKPVLKPIAVAM